MGALVTPDVMVARAGDLFPSAAGPMEGTWGYGGLSPFGAVPPPTLGTPAEAVANTAQAAADSHTGRMGGFSAWLTPGNPAFVVTALVLVLIFWGHVDRLLPRI